MLRQVDFLVGDPALLAQLEVAIGRRGIRRQLNQAVVDGGAGLHQGRGRCHHRSCTRPRGCTVGRARAALGHELEVGVGRIRGHFDAVVVGQHVALRPYQPTSAPAGAVDQQPNDRATLGVFCRFGSCVTLCPLRVVSSTDGLGNCRRQTRVTGWEPMRETIDGESIGALIVAAVKLNNCKLTRNVDRPEAVGQPELTLAGALVGPRPAAIRRPHDNEVAIGQIESGEMGTDVRSQRREDLGRPDQLQPFGHRPSIGVFGLEDFLGFNADLDPLRQVRNELGFDKVPNIFGRPIQRKTDRGHAQRHHQKREPDRLTRPSLATRDCVEHGKPPTSILSGLSGFSNANR